MVQLCITCMQKRVSEKIEIENCKRFSHRQRTTEEKGSLPPLDTRSGQKEARGGREQAGRDGKKRQ